MSEINACPFCGRDGETFDWYPLGKPITQYGCGPCNFWTNNLDTWNRRSAPPTWPDVGDARDAEVARLNAIINTPHADDFIRAVSIEAEHQRQRWGAEGDAGKTPADWFWLVGYLAGKALHSHAVGTVEKSEHHIITTAAACANWHRALFGKTDMRPGHEEGLDAMLAPIAHAQPTEPK